MKLSVSTLCKLLFTKRYDEFKIVFVYLSPCSICVPVYSGKYLRGSNDKYLFHALYMVTFPMSTQHENLWEKNV